MAKVLVIDDDAEVRRMVIRFLKTAGHEAVEAVDGKDGIDALIHARFDLVITDIIMPDADGIETIQQIKELRPDLPIIAISGSGTAIFSPLDDARLMGADITLNKPFQVDTLLSAVAKLLDGRGTEA